MIRIFFFYYSIMTICPEKSSLVEGLFCIFEKNKQLSYSYIPKREKKILNIEEFFCLFFYRTIK
jgi:hypothetical protein